MLSREEEIDITKILYTAKEEKKEFLRVSNHIRVDDIILLAKRALEINEECSQVTLELQKANEELARLHEVYGA